jgi:hypothetical protein
LSTQLPERLKNFLPLKTIFLFIFTIVVVFIIYLSHNVFNNITEKYEQSVYEETSDKILSKYKMLFKERFQTSFIFATTISKYDEIKNYLLSNQTQNLDLKYILEDLQSKKEYVNMQVEIISTQGISLKRSWTDIVGDNVFQNNQYLNPLLLEPKAITTVESNNFGMSISNKIPIYNQNKLIGYLGLNVQFDSILEEFENEGFKSIILLNKENSRDIDPDIAFSSKFIDDVYVVNKNADSYIMKLVKQSGVDNYFLSNWISSYKIEESSGYLISKLDIKNLDGYTLASLFIFKNIDEISMKEIDYIKDAHVTTTLLIVLFVAFVLNFLYALSKVKILDKENRSLIIKNENLNIKTNEMDFQDKKLENLFNSQPNLMIMHNGKEITEGNKRFRGFFNRFKTIDGFRQKHKCVSELFEEYRAPNYIFEQIIEGKFWIDYILANPKRLYKVVIPYKDSKREENHHFIVKLNEMEYAGKVDERLIIIALVDITQDLPNYKNIESGQQND